MAPFLLMGSILPMLVKVRDLTAVKVAPEDLVPSRAVVAEYLLQLDRYLGRGKEVLDPEEERADFSTIRVQAAQADMQARELDAVVHPMVEEVRMESTRSFL